jgi:hypothetical protein
MRFAFLLAPLPVLIAGACSLESGGLASDAGADSPGVEDRGIGMTDSGMTCLCVPPPPTGWVFLAYQPDSVAGCPADFAKQTFVKETSGGGAPTCSCNCMATVAPTCAVDKMTVTIGDGSQCTNGQTFSMVSPNGAGCYDNQDFNDNISDWVSGTATFKINGTCTPNEMNVIPPRTDHLGQTCVLTGALGSGCAGMDTCVPKAPAGYLQCVQKDEANAACPPGFPNQHRAGSGVNDDRGCTPCTCTPAATCAATVELHGNPTCNDIALASPLALDGVCRDTTKTHLGIHSMLAAATTSAPTCTKGGSVPGGTISLAMERTICCQ